MHGNKNNLQKYPDIIISFLSKLVTFYLIFMLIPLIFCIFSKLFESVKSFEIICLFTLNFTENRKKLKNTFEKTFFSKILKMDKNLNVPKLRQAMVLTIKIHKL